MANAKKTVPTIEPIETIPGIKGGVSAIASGNAPIVFFDNCPTFGSYNGIAHITLTVMRFMPTSEGESAQDHAVVAHLRMNFAALTGLKEAIQKIEQGIAAPTPQQIN